VFDLAFGDEFGHGADGLGERHGGVVAVRRSVQMSAAGHRPASTAIQRSCSADSTVSTHRPASVRSAIRRSAYWMYAGRFASHNAW
ncbi:hypothetical protein AB0R12_40890, partial [Streptomyces niveus]|uniref:hypothetical protein n=1 Tax=Streptomyces niveus TaxID=193462 RepID=UPI00341E3306